ncbi:MAG: hypothetical protein O3A47_04135 [Chloroflexi bacterium]|nr:hypothetical protein [Chloroflexota bacterium]
MENVVDFTFATAVAETQTSMKVHGEVQGVLIDHTSGTPTLTINIVCNGVTQVIYTKASPADGAFNPVRRMQTTAGADNSGAGEYTHFYAPKGSVITAVVGAAWTGNIRVALS